MHQGERLNTCTHLVGMLLALGGAATLLAMAAQRGDPSRMVGFAIYGASLFTLYLASTCYHGTRGTLKAFFRKLDHTAIYLLIAGTYTPFALVSLDAESGHTLLVASWSLALVGILQEIWVAKGARLTSLALYVIMGWMGLALVDPLSRALTWDGLAWLVGGGLVYTGGIVFYLFDERFKHWHGIWHLFVMAGSALHYATIVKFVA